MINKRQRKEVSRQESYHVQQFKSRLKYIKAQQVCVWLLEITDAVLQDCTVVSVEQGHEEV